MTPVTGGGPGPGAGLGSVWGWLVCLELGWDWHWVGVGLSGWGGGRRKQGGLCDVGGGGVARHRRPGELFSHFWYRDVSAVSGHRQEADPLRFEAFLVPFHRANDPPTQANDLAREAATDVALHPQVGPYLEKLRAFKPRLQAALTSLEKARRFVRCVGYPQETRALFTEGLELGGVVASKLVGWV